MRPKMLFEAPSFARRITAFLVAIPMALVAVLLAPASAKAAEVERYRFNGVVVTGYDLSVDEVDECVVTVHSVTASKELVTFYSQIFNQCAGGSGGEEQFIATGSAAPTYFATRGTRAAHVIATVPLYDISTGDFVGDVELDNIWTAAGPAVRDRSSYSTSLPGSYRLSYRTSGTVAPATVTGTVPFETHATIGRYTEMQLSIIN
jgi:hypothetical protein